MQIPPESPCIEYDDDILPNIIDMASTASYSSRFSIRRAKFASLEVYNKGYKCCYNLNIRGKHTIYHHYTKKTKAGTEYIYRRPNDHI